MQFCRFRTKSCMSKFYAVRIGKCPGVYNTWKECQAQVMGYSGASYKSFPTFQEANNFVGVVDNAPIVNNPVGSIKSYSDEIHIYTDGSHQRAHIYLGIGAWTRYNGIEYSLSTSCSKELLNYYGITETSCSNPTAEFLAFAEVLRRFTSINNDNIIIIFYCDYLGVQNWMSGAWQCKERYIGKIRDVCHYYLSLMKCKVEIRHVKGHSGVEGNEMADVLAGSHNEVDTLIELVQLLSNV